MKPNDLRIGNLVYRQDLSDGYTRTETVISLGEKAVLSGPIKVICAYTDLSPIPITEEWLERFGFEKNRKEYFTIYTLHKYGFEIEYEFRNGKLLSCTLECIPIECGYVHNFQNLYFALTGEELKTVHDNPELLK